MYDCIDKAVLVILLKRVFYTIHEALVTSKQLSPAGCTQSFRQTWNNTSRPGVWCDVFRRRRNAIVDSSETPRELVIHLKSERDQTEPGCQRFRSFQSADDRYVASARLRLKSPISLRVRSSGVVCADMTSHWSRGADDEAEAEVVESIVSGKLNRLPPAVPRSVCVFLSSTFSG